MLDDLPVLEAAHINHHNRKGPARRRASHQPFAVRAALPLDARQPPLEFAAHEGDHSGQGDGRRTANTSRGVIGQRPSSRDKPDESGHDAKHAPREQKPEPGGERCFLSRGCVVQGCFLPVCMGCDSTTKP